MPTYYETLNVPPSATAAEITSACDSLYDQWRRLTNHHDDGTRLQATQALQQIEAMRTTLTDASQRRAYDAGIGVGGAVGGLVDLSAVPGAPVFGAGALGGAPTPPAPSPTNGSAAAPAAPGLWACPSCKTDNPPNTKFCLKDGTQLVRECPECKRMSSLIATGFCGECGYPYDVAARRGQLRTEISQAQQQLAAEQKRLQESEAAESAASKALSEAEVISGQKRSSANWRLAFTIFGILGSILTGLAGHPLLGGFILMFIIAGFMLLFASAASRAAHAALGQAEAAHTSAQQAERNQAQTVESVDSLLKRLQTEHDTLAVR